MPCRSRRDSDVITQPRGLTDAPQDTPIIGRLVLSEVIYRLLAGPAGARLRQIATLGTHGNKIATVIELAPVSKADQAA